MVRNIILPVYEGNETVFERRSCDKCEHASSDVPPVCLYKRAVDYWKSNETDKIHCPYWHPHYGKLERVERGLMEKYGYKKPGIRSRIISTLEKWYEHTLPSVNS